MEASAHAPSNVEENFDELCANAISHGMLSSGHYDALTDELAGMSDASCVERAAKMLCMMSSGTVAYSAEAQVWALTVIHNFGCDGVDAQHALLSAGCIEACIAALSQHASHSAVQAASLDALASLTRDFAAAAKAMILSGTARVILRAMRQHERDAKVQANATELLFNLMSADVGEPTHETLCASLETEAAESVLLRTLVLHRHVESTFAFTACLVAAGTCHGCPEAWRLRLLQERRLPRALVVGMEAHARSEWVQTAALSALQGFARQLPEGREAVRASKALGAARAACTAFPQTHVKDDAVSLCELIRPHQPDEHDLKLALERADVPALDAVLAARPELMRHRYEQGCTALMYMVDSQSYAAVERLLQLGAPCDEPDDAGSTCLDHAAQLADVRLVDLLLAAGASPARSAGALILACSEQFGAQDTIIVERLLKRRADVDARLPASNGPDGMTALMGASHRTDARLAHRLVTLLLASGANADLQEHTQGNSALMLAVAQGDSHAGVVECLVSHRADLGLVEHTMQYTALGLAMAGKHEAAAAPLIEATDVDEMMSQLKWAKMLSSMKEHGYDIADREVVRRARQTLSEIEHGNE